MKGSQRLLFVLIEGMSLLDALEQKLSTINESFSIYGNQTRLPCNPKFRTFWDSLYIL